MTMGMKKMAMEIELLRWKVVKKNLAKLKTRASTWRSLPKGKGSSRGIPERRGMSEKWWGHAFMIENLKLSWRGLNFLSRNSAVIFHLSANLFLFDLNINFLSCFFCYYMMSRTSSAKCLLLLNKIRTDKMKPITVQWWGDFINICCLQLSSAQPSVRALIIWNTMQAILCILKYEKKYILCWSGWLTPLFKSSKVTPWIIHQQSRSFQIKIEDMRLTEAQTVHNWVQ